MPGFRIKLVNQGVVQIVVCNCSISNHTTILLCMLCSRRYVSTACCVAGGMSALLVWQSCTLNLTVLINFVENKWFVLPYNISISQTSNEMLLHTVILCMAVCIDQLVFRGAVFQHKHAALAQHLHVVCAY
jgi:hypothetical protein